MEKYRTTSIKIISLGLLFLVLCSAKCSKTPIEPNDSKTPLEQLPAATQTGENTFGCLVNDEIFLPKGNVYSGGITSFSYLQDNGTFGINTKNIKDFNPSIYINVYIQIGVFEKGKFESIIYPNVSTLELFSQASGFTEYFIDSTSNHFIEITKLDLENKIVSGLFEFTVVSQDKSDTIRVTNGRFDLNNLFIQ